MKTFHVYNDWNGDICHYPSEVMTVNTNGNTVWGLGSQKDWSGPLHVSVRTKRSAAHAL